MKSSTNLHSHWNGRHDNNFRLNSYPSKLQNEYLRWMSERFCEFSNVTKFKFESVVTNHQTSTD